MFYRWEWNTLKLALLVSAWAKVDVFGKVRWEELKVSIKKAPEQWKATQYLLEWLSEAFWVNQKSVILVSGALISHKQVEILQPTKIPQELKYVLEFPKKRENF